MGKYDQYLRTLTEDETSAIQMVVKSINENPGTVVEVQINTLDSRMTCLIVEMIKQVKAKCRSLNGCTVFADRIVFGEKGKK